MYNPKTRKIIISRDVIFDEGGAWIHQKLYVGDPPNDVNSTNMQSKNQSKISPPRPPSPPKTSNDSTSSSSTSTLKDKDTQSVVKKGRRTLVSHP